MSFREELSQLARQEEFLRQTCQTKEFLQFYKEQKEALRNHVKSAPEKDFQIYIPRCQQRAYFEPCLIGELHKEDIETSLKIFRDRVDGDLKIVQLPSSQWK